MYKFIIFSLFIIFTGINSSEAQQNILLMNGKRIFINDSRVDSSGIILYKNKKNKVKYLEIADVFSMTRIDSVEVIFYKPSCSEECFKVEEMRAYLTGLAFGRDKKHFVILAGSFATGTVSGYFIPSYLSFIPSLGFSLITGAINPKDKNLDIPEKYKENKHFILGYKKGIKKKRIICSIIGGASGIISGIVIRNIIIENNDR